MRVMGFDALGLLSPQFDAKKFVQALPNGTALGLLLDWPNPKFENLDIVMDSGKISLVRAHVLNAVCVRNRNCCASEGKKGLNSKKFNKAIIDGKFDERFVDLLEALEAGLFLAAPHDLYISPLLEHDQSKEAWQRLAKLTQSAMPWARLVNNPHSGWKGRYSGSILERHGAGPKAQCSSLDGESLFDIDVPAWRKRTQNEVYTMSWIWEANGRKKGEVRKCPDKRTNFPDGALFRKWVNKTIRS